MRAPAQPYVQKAIQRKEEEVPRCGTEEESVEALSDSDIARQQLCAELHEAEIHIELDPEARAIERGLYPAKNEEGNQEKETEKGREDVPEFWDEHDERCRLEELKRKESSAPATTEVGDAKRNGFSNNHPRCKNCRAGARPA